MHGFHRRKLPLAISHAFFTHDPTSQVMRTAQRTAFGHVFASVIGMAALLASTTLLAFPKSVTAFAVPAGAWGMRLAPAPVAVSATYVRRMGSMAMVAPETVVQDVIKKPAVIFRWEGREGVGREG
ncbi:hypothetical protein Naga_101254g1, partial [Nannochloropsis gaditana]